MYNYDIVFKLSRKHILISNNSTTSLMYDNINFHEILYSYEILV